MYDEIFLFGLEVSEVDSGHAKRLHFAVRKFGSRAWEKNAKLKTLGEKRVLKRFPEHFTVSWSDFKRRPDVFAD